MTNEEFVIIAFYFLLLFFSVSSRDSRDRLAEIIDWIKEQK